MFASFSGMNSVAVLGVFMLGQEEPTGMLGLLLALGGGLVLVPGLVRRLDAFLPWAPDQVDGGDVSTLRLCGLVLSLQAAIALIVVFFGGRESVRQWGEVLLGG
jgi:hypothetical protein